jgi:hypothetical protein
MTCHLEDPLEDDWLLLAHSLPQSRPLAPFFTFFAIISADAIFDHGPDSRSYQY